MKKYKIIYADPPWRYKNKRTGGSMKSGSSQKYSTMDFEEVKKLPVEKIANSNSVLFLWSTVPFLPKILKVMESWGYRYKTSIFWEKIGRLGMGFWFRGQVEILLVGIKGEVKPFRIQKKNILHVKIRGHSQKPDEFYELIEMIKLKPRIELFARNKRKGWDVWGNEVESDIKMEIVKK